MSTILALLLSIYLFATGQAAFIYEQTVTARIILGVFPLAGFFIMSSLLAGALQRSEKTSSPRAIELVMQNTWMKGINYAIFILPIITIPLSSNFGSYDNNALAFCLWLIAFGISLDMLFAAKKIFWNSINPFSYVAAVQKQAKSALHHNRQTEIPQWIDALAEQAYKSLAAGAVALGAESLNGLQGIISSFCDSSKGRLLNKGNDDEALAEISYTVSFFCQRVGAIFQKALEKHSEPMASQAIVLLGKTAIFAAKCDPGMALEPLHLLGKLALEAQSKEYEEIAIKSEITLQQVGMAFTSDINLFSLPLQEIFLSIIKSMEALSKNAFKKDKNVNLELLVNPFRQLKGQFIKEEQIVQHPDAPVILQELDRVIGEFEALGQILTNMPNVPGYANQG